MANKFPGRTLAVGAWSNPYKRLILEQSAEKVRVLLEDKMIGKGKLADLYLPVSSSTAGVVACTCVKDTSSTADRQCMTCHGTKYAPGYLRFLHSTIFFCSAEHEDFTLTNASISTEKKANVIVMDEDETSCTIVTPDKDFTNPSDADWSVKLDVYKRSIGATVALEWSRNSGTTWVPVTLTEVTGEMGFGYTGAIAGDALDDEGTIRFRVTMTRLSADDLPPAFEIVRIRRPRPEHTNRKWILRRRSDYEHGKILVLRPWVQEQDSIEPGRGIITDHLGNKAWTNPLDFFDRSLTRDTPQCKVADSSTTGPHPFYQVASGVQTGTRYAITKTYVNDQMGNPGLFTQQWFDDRRAQENDPYLLVW